MLYAIFQINQNNMKTNIILFSLISLLSFDVYMKKNMIETLIDDYSSKHIKDNKSNEKDNKK